MKVRIIETINLESWQQLADNSISANFFQTSLCYEFYKSLSFLEAFCLGVTENQILKGVIVGYIQKDGGRLKQFFSKRAVIIGGPLLADDISNETVTMLLNQLKRKLRNRSIYIETRNFNDYSNYVDAFAKSGFKYNAHLNFQIDTSSIEIAHANLGKSRKRDIKTSCRDGATFLEVPTLNQVRDFYEILDELYCTKIKTPLFPFEFFEKLYHSAFSKFLFVVAEDKVIGGTVCVVWNNKVVYEWFAGGKDYEYRKYYPSTMATYWGIKYASESGIPRFDMMGAGKPEESYGVRDFKAKFGGKLVEHGRFIHIVNPLLYKIGKVGVKILRNRKLYF